MKKGLLLTSCLSTSLLFIAYASYSENSGIHSIAQITIPNSLFLKDGFYVGAAGGYDTYSINNHINNVSIINTQPIDPSILPSPPISLRLNQKSSANNGLGGIFVGYGRSFPKYKAYLGIEIFGSWLDASSTTYALTQSNIYDSSNSSDLYPGYYLSSQNITNSIQIENNFGFSIRPGIKWHKSNLLYIRLGYGLSTVAINQTISTAVSFQDVNFNVTPIGTAVTSSHQSHTIGGFSCGIGIEQAVYKNWSLRAEYLHTDYSNLNINAIGSTIIAADNRYMLGIIYHI